MFQAIIDWFKELLTPINRKAKADFDWTHPSTNDFTGSEEVFDSETKIFGRTYFIFYLTIGLIFAGLWFKLWSLQVAQGGYYKQLAEENRIRTRTEQAPRGLIYDCDGRILAQNQAGFSLMVYPADLPDGEKARKKINQKLKKLVNFDQKKWEEMEDQYLYRLEPIILKENLTQKRALILKEKTAQMPGVVVEDQIKRLYNSSASLAHLVGYIGKISSEELESPVYSDLSLTNYTGKTGLERVYDKYLRGTEGKKQVEVDSAGRVKRVLAEKEAKVGNSLVLSIDYDLQRKMAETLAKTLLNRGLNKGVAIVSDPMTGQILGLVSQPDYNNNIFSSPQVNKKYSQLLNDQDRPLFNRVISGLYPSGSVIKPVVAAGALQDGSITVNTWIDCHGAIEVKNRFNPEIIYRFTDWETHGSVNVVKALAQSCNVFFYHLGGGFGNINGLGFDRLHYYFEKFGLGQKTEIDLSLEKEGLIPTPEWKERVKKEVWYQGDNYHLAIGQGDLLTTPIQVNNYVSAIANGGNLLKPYLVKEILKPDKKLLKKIKPQYLKKNLVSKSTIDIIKQGMRAAVTSGTATPLSSLPVSSAGKTGTAQTPQGEGREHSWFTAFAPYENPEVVITVMVENGGEGYEVALPIAREILNYYFTR